MSLRLPGSRPLLPIPPSVVLTLLWVGLVRLLFLFVMAKAQTQRDGNLWLAVLFEERVMGRGRLPTLLVAVSFLLLVYLWVDYRSRPAGRRLAAVYLVAAALLAYVGWAIWRFWWIQLDTLHQPVDVLMTAGPGATGLAAA